MKIIFKTASIAVAFLIHFSVNAQDIMNLSLDSAINFAIEHNKSLLNAKYTSQRTHEKVWETTASGLPQVSASVDYNNFLGAEASIRFSEQAPATTIAFNPTSSFSFSVSQLVFSGSFYVGLQLAKLADQTNQISYKKSEIDVREQVTRAYFLILVAERTLSIMEANKQNTQHLYEKTKNIANAGIVEKTEADKIALMVTSLENATKATERQVEMAYNMLRLQLGVDANVNIKLITKLEDVSNQNKFETTLINPFSLDNNFDYKLLQMQEQISKKQINLEQAGYLPTLVGFYSYTEKLLKPKFDMTPKNVVGLKLSVPIFSSGMRRSKVSQSKINLKITENNIDLLSQQLQIQEKQLRFNLNNMLEQYKSQKVNVDLAKEIYDKMSLKFQQGIISSLELTSANSNYLSAESSYTNILFQLLDAEIALRKISGNL